MEVIGNNKIDEQRNKKAYVQQQDFLV